MLLSRGRRSSLTGAAFVAALASVSLFAQDVALRYRWTAGDEVRYRNTTQSDVVMSGVPGMGDMTVGTTMVQVTKMSTDDVAADGAATVRTLYESIKMTMSSPMFTLTYDSANPSASAGDPMMEALGKSLGLMVGESFTMVVTPAGKVLKIDGLARMLEKAKASAPEAAAALSMAGGLEGLMGEEAQRSTIEQSFASLPAKPVKVGDTWKNELKMPNPFGAMLASFALTLKGVEKVDGRDVARIATTATIKPAAGAAPGAMGPMTVTMGDGTSQGEMLFDVQLGRVHKATAVVTLPMTMSMAAPDGTSISLQAATKTTTTMEIVK